MALLRTCCSTGSSGSKLLPPRFVRPLPAPLVACLPAGLASPPPILARSSGAGARSQQEARRYSERRYSTIQGEELLRGDAQSSKLAKLQKEVKGLRADVQRLSMMLEQDFVGYRRSASQKEKDSDPFWRTSVQGPSSLTPAEPEEGMREVVTSNGHSDGNGHSDRREEVRPSVRTAQMQPTHISEMAHSTLAHLALSGNHFAHRERMIREIMSVDNVTWEKAHDVLAEMDEYKERHYWYVTMPYRFGIVTATFFGIASCFLVFHPATAYWYGRQIANEDLPEDKPDISAMTINQVGTWTWQWMEPMIGTASFVLLCAQFMRGQYLKLNMKSFLDIMESRKATMLADRYKLYDRSMVRTWAKPLPRAKPNFFPIFERTTGMRGPSSGL